MTFGTARPDARPVSTLPTAGMATAAGAAILAAALALAVTPAPAAAQSACGGYHTMDAGETLAGIAVRCGVTLPALLAANPGVVDDRDVDVGSRLRVPDPGAGQPSPVQACGPYYTVRTGDTVEEIATKCGLTIPLLASANAPFPAQLGMHAGMAVRIPDVPPAAVLDPATVAAVRQLIAADAAAREAVVDTAAGGEAEAPRELVRVEGVLESGPRCMRVRNAGGERFAIAGDLDGAFRAGDRVVLMGVEAPASECEASPTLELRILYRADPTGGTDARSPSPESRPQA